MSKTRTKTLKLDLGAGQNCTPGFESVDLNADADHQVNLFAFPWPFEDNTVREVVSSHLVEHIPHYRPEYEGRDGWDLFWAEVWRICRKGAQVTVIHPYVKNSRAFWDPTHVRFIHSQTWYYLNREWREINRLEHYFGDYDFEVQDNMSAPLRDDLHARNPEFQAQACEREWDAMGDLTVVLKVRK